MSHTRLLASFLLAFCRQFEKSVNLEFESPSEELMGETHIAGTSSIQFTSLYPHVNRRHNLLPYWQKHTICDISGNEVEYSSDVHHSCFPTFDHDMASHSFPSNHNSINEPKCDPQDEKIATPNKGFTQNPPGNPPLVSLHEKKNRDAKSKRSQAVASTSVISRSHAAKERCAIKHRTEKRRRDNLRPAGKPLSKIAAETPDVIVLDAQAFAHRPVEDRRREAANAGKIKRPLNAFMLYRWSYQNVAKTRCLRNNHQQISTVCGDSWKSHESPDIIEKFKELACLEKEMHKLAFPHYVYDPAMSEKIGNGMRLPIPSYRGLLDDSSPHSKPSKQVPRRRGDNGSNFTHGSQSSEDEPFASESGTGTAVDFNSYYGLPPSRSAIPCEPSDFMQIDNCAHRDQNDSAPPGDPRTLGGVDLPMTGHVEHGMMDPTLYIFDPSYIHTTLSTVPRVPCHYDDAICQQFPVLWCNEERYDEQAMIKPDPGVAVPELGNRGVHIAYLKGPDEDWKARVLDAGNRFQD